MAGRKRGKWGRTVRRVTNLSRAVQAALASKTVDPDYRPSAVMPGTTLHDTSAVEAEDRFAYLESSIHPMAGSTAQEDAFCGTRGAIGVVPLLGGLAFHDIDSRFNAAGLPDAIAIVGRTLYLIEFKSEREYPRGAQKDWLAALAEVDTVVTGVVKPSGWQTFIRFVRERLHAEYLEQRKGRDD
jgi:hypothetical protein